MNPVAFFMAGLCSVSVMFALIVASVPAQPAKQNRQVVEDYPPLVPKERIELVQYPAQHPPQVNDEKAFRTLTYGGGFAGKTISWDDFSNMMDLSREQLAELREIKALLRAGSLIGGLAARAVPQQALAEVPDAVKLATAKEFCASCHTPSKADVSGGGFIMFADDQATKLLPLSMKDRERVSELVSGKVERGEMPPKDRKQVTPDKKSHFRHLWK